MNYKYYKFGFRVPGAGYKRQITNLKWFVQLNILSQVERQILRTQILNLPLPFGERIKVRGCLEF